ncbi:MAG: CvpA family protein [Pontiellaceae bacterium]
MEWSGLDIGASVVALLFGVFGLREGFARQLATLITFVLTMVALYVAYPVLLEYLANHFPDWSIAKVTALGLLALALLSIGLFVLLKQLLASAMLTNISDGTDKGLGFLFGFLRGSVLAILLLSLVAQLGSELIRSELQDRSLVGRWVCERIAPMATEYVNRERVEEQMDALRDRVKLPTPAEVIE